MGTRDFLDLVLPFQGNKVIALAVPRQDGGVWFKYKSYKDAEAAARAAEIFDARGETVYFAVNAFGDWYHCPEKDKPRIRTQENVIACRAIFDDFDVDPEKNRKAREQGKPEPCYDTREEAFADVVKLAQALRLTPTIISSGGGYHVYFHLEEDIDPVEWEDLSTMKRDICNHLGVRYDTAVDTDSARVLRPVGVHNRKYDPPRKVELLKEGKTYSVEHVRSKLQGYIKANNVPPAPSTGKKGPAAANPFAAALGDFPPSDAETVAEHCAAIREFRDTGGDIPEPHWHRAIGVVKFCEGGEDIIHAWSKGYDGYTFEETQAKIEEWTVGPTSCVEMDRHVGCMATCPMAGKCKFPIQLGFTEDAPSVEEETVVASPSANPGATSTKPAQTPPAGMGATIEGQFIPYWPQAGYRWNGATLARSYTDDDGVVHWRPFCRSFIYPLNRVRDSEGTWVIHWRTKEKNGAWRDFFMPTAELASTDMMAKTLASHEVFLTRTKSARNDMAEFAEGLIETLQEWRVETKTYSQFGWTEDRKGFVLGTKMLTENGEEDVLCDPDMPPDVAVDFGTSGSVDEWVKNIDALYNRPGAEPFQFALCHSMGSVLVEMFGSSNWHGLPLAFTGHGGTGKSTAAKIACGFYGRPKLMERQTGEQGSTLNAAIKRIAIMGSIPVLLDEFSGRSADELTRTGYALANGRDKERLGSSGKFATVGGEWYKNSFITSNDSLHETISKLPAGYRVEATQLRFFEVQLPKDYRSTVFPDITQEFIEHHMDNVYGSAFRPYIRFIVKNHDWVRRQIAAARSKFNPKSEDDNKERFYRDTIVTALVAGKIAEKLGLIQFDVGGMKKWAVAQVERMREGRREHNVDISEQLALLIASLPGRLIITKHFGDARSGSAEHPMEQLRAPAVGRVCTEDKKVYITVKAVSDWCKENGVAPSEMRDELDRAGYLVFATDGKPSHNVRIGAGTTMPSSSARCYELNYHKLFHGTALSLVPSGRGVTTEVKPT
jgi:hypothetical protein